MQFWKMPKPWACADPTPRRAAAAGAGVGVVWVLTLRLIVLLVVGAGFAAALVAGVEPVVALGAIAAGGVIAGETAVRLFGPTQAPGQV